MKTTTEQKLINVFGQNTLFDLQRQAERKGKWIARHCNTLYITQFNKEDNSFSYFIERKSNRLHKFKDRCKINFFRKNELHTDNIQRPSGDTNPHSGDSTLQG